MRLLSMLWEELSFASFVKYVETVDKTVHKTRFPQMHSIPQLLVDVAACDLVHVVSMISFTPLTQSQNQLDLHNMFTFELLHVLRIHTTKTLPIDFLYIITAHLTPFSRL